LNTAVASDAASGASGTWLGGGSPSPILNADMMLGASAVQGAAESVLSTVVNKLNNAVNENKYNTKKTGILFWRRDQTTREKVGTLRTLAKGNLENFIDKFAKWQESHAAFLALQGQQRTPAEIAVILLRRQKHQQQVTELSKLVYEFFELVVSEANKMVDSVEEIGENAAKEAIDVWIKRHPRFMCCSGECYNSTTNVVKAVLRDSYGIAADVPNDNMNWSKCDGIPAYPVRGESPAEEFLRRMGFD
jgi:hypothetical protein